MTEHETEQQPFITETQLAYRLSLGLGAVRRHRNNGTGPPFVRIGPKTIRYSPAAVDAWIESRTAVEA